ncbi:MAG: ATP-binding protein [Pseudomonadota bacterium]|nr:ATP-binding protein [Pseudomonadota bacterium]
MRTHNAAPSALSFLESLRDIGYSLETAVADILDNSITAKASEIQILLNVNSLSAEIAVIDNGTGMTEEELIEAMRPGSKNPLDSRSKNDLGRFGLGLKTASFSQCRRLTVVTRKHKTLSAAQWDMDFVAQQEKDEWTLQIPEGEEINRIPYADHVPETGTLVLWEKLDRLEDATENTPLEDHLYERFDTVRKHVELIFHRFLEGERPFNKVKVTINGEPIAPFDPFNSKHPATILLPEEIIQVRGAAVKIQPYVLPHHKKTTPEEWAKYGGDAGYLKNQGFYVYRAGRLIIYGTWFRLAQQAELTKLSRVRVDMPNELDHLWKIDVKKASAQPPLVVRERLKKIIERIGGASNKVYTQRGIKLTQPNINAIWARRVNKNEISYEIDLQHPAVMGFYEMLDEDQAKKFDSLVKVFGEYLPIDSLFHDVAEQPENMLSDCCDAESLKSLLELTCVLYRQKYPKIENKDILERLKKTEPFKSNYKATQFLLESEFPERLK